jgi:hypothetical protein
LVGFLGPAALAVSADAEAGLMYAVAAVMLVGGWSVMATWVAQRDEAREEAELAGRAVEPRTFVEAEVLGVRQKLGVVQAGCESFNEPLWEVVSPWVSHLYCNLQEFGWTALAEELHPDDNVPRPEDEAGQQEYLAHRSMEIDRILERLRAGGR